MNEYKPDMATINAYVDGEMEAPQAARVAKAIAADSELASIVAKLHAMKSAVGTAFTNQEVIAVTHDTQFFSRTFLWATAACLLVALIGSGMWYTLIESVSNRDIAQAIRLHDSWVLEAQGTAATTVPVLALVTPDLTPAGLTLAGVQRNLQLGKTPSTRYAYVGSRGCKLSLFVSKNADAFASLEGLARPDALIVKWTVANRRFLLIARKMNEQRFRVIATALEAATTKAISLDEPMRQALRQSHQPCLA